MMFRWLLLALLGVAAASVVGNIAQHRVIQHLNNDLIAAEISYQNCSTRLAAIRRDQESDRTIDETPDDQLLDLADPDWLLPPGNTGE